MANTMHLIQTYTVPSSTNSFSFNTIPATYTDLVIYYQAQITNSGTGWYDFLMTLNGSTSGYSGNTNYADGTGGTTPTKLSITESSSAIVQRCNTNTSPNTQYSFSVGKIYIPNYRSSLTKTLLNDHVTEQQNTTGNGAAGLFANATRWNSTAAINTITVTGLSGNNITAGSTFSIYGIS